MPPYWHRADGCACVHVGWCRYPEAHTECWNSPDLPPSQQSKDLDLRRLKEKVDAGADFIVTQFFYDVPAFLQFVAVRLCVCVCKGSGCVLVFTNANRFRPCQNARAIGITCPILPGHMVVQTYRGFKRFTTWCKTKVPREMSARLEEVKDNDEAVKAYGVELGTRTCEQLLASGTRSLHFYTMNLSLSVKRILQNLNMVPARHERSMPWSVQKRDLRATQEVRPIFWNNRAASYLARTSTWDEFPNGRWGDNRSPAYGSLSGACRVGVCTLGAGSTASHPPVQTIT